MNTPDDDAYWFGRGIASVTETSDLAITIAWRGKRVPYSLDLCGPAWVSSDGHALSDEAEDYAREVCETEYL